jgi:hypothetical protein
MTPQERAEAVKAEQEGMTKEEIAAELEQRFEHTFDLDNMPKQKHNFVKRGIVISCEGADHPSHRHFLTSK